MYKRIILIIIFINTFSTSIYSMFDNTNNTKGFYFDTSLLGQHRPIEGDWKSKLFYRMPLLDNGNSLFESTKLEIGLEGELGISGNSADIYVDIIPIDFFGIKVKTGWVSYNKQSLNSSVNFGFYTFDDINLEYNDSVFYENQSENKNGYYIEIEPTFYIDVYIFTLISGIKITYQDMFTDDFYYDRFTYLLRKNKTISAILNNYFIFNISPVNIGLNYSLTYMGDFYEDFSDNLSHKLGIAASYSHAFSDIFSLYSHMHLGQYLKYNYLTTSIYFELTVGVQLKIF